MVRRRYLIYDSQETRSSIDDMPSTSSINYGTIHQWNSLMSRLAAEL